MESYSDYRSRIYKTYPTPEKAVSGEMSPTQYSQWAKIYYRYLSPWLPADKDAEIADLACGDGRLLRMLESLGYQKLRAVDISPIQVRAAGQSGISIDQADAIDWLHGRQGQFDLITAIDLIEHFKKEEVLEFLEASAAALKPGGRIILQTVNGASPFGSAVRYGDFSHETAFTPTSLIHLLHMAGFSNFNLREAGPIFGGHSFRSTCRAIVWQIIRALLMTWNLAETGSKGGEIFTRVFLITAIIDANQP